MHHPLQCYNILVIVKKIEKNFNFTYFYQINTLDMDANKQLSINYLYPEIISSVKLKIKIKKVQEEKIIVQQIDLNPNENSHQSVVSNEKFIIIENYFS
jgi:hypothetical protein